MEFHQLKYFLTVAKLKNFTRAAEHCQIAQPSLSQQIQKLEKELGAPLFHRQGRTICLTNIGELLLPIAHKLIFEHDNAIENIKDIVNKGGTVRFGAILTIAPYLIPYLLEYIDEQLTTTFRIEENFTQNLLINIKSGTLDFAIMSSPVDEPNLMVKTIAKEPFVLVMKSGHPLAKKEKIMLADVFNHPFLELSNIHCAGQQISEFCNLSARQTNTIFQSAQIETILQLVKQGRGITLLPKMALGKLQDKSLVSRNLDEKNMEREITLVQHPDRYLSQATRATIQQVQEGIKAFVSSN